MTSKYDFRCHPRGKIVCMLLATLFISVSIFRKGVEYECAFSVLFDVECPSAF